jgi:hypothetical protein
VRRQVAIDSHLANRPFQLRVQRTDRQRHRQHGGAEDIEAVDVLDLDHAHRPAAMALDLFLQPPRRAALSF